MPRAGYSGNNTWVLVRLDKLTLKSHVLAKSFPGVLGGAVHAMLDQFARAALAFLILLPTNPQTFSNHDQIGQRFGAHFSHNVAAVNLYCPFAYADLACDLLVHKAAGHERHNLALARG